MRNVEENRIMQKWRVGLAAFALGLAMPMVAWAQNAIQSITSTQQAGTEVVRIELKEPLAAVPRGLFDPDASAHRDRPAWRVATNWAAAAVEINQGNLRSVAVAQAGERTRLVLSLKQPPRPSRPSSTARRCCWCSTPSATVAVAKPGEPVQFAPPQNTEPQSLRDIDFRRGPDGAGRVIVTLPSTQVGVDIRQQGQSLVVEFLRSTLPEALRRRLDVTDFGTPVQTVSTFQRGDRVRMVVEPRGAWEHSAYQTDNQFVLEVRPLKVDPNKLTQGPGFQGEKLSLNFQNIEVRALLQVIADFTNFNVVTSDTVTGNVTLRLKDVPWDQALDIILQSKGLGVRKNGNVLWIAPKDELTAKEQLDLEAKKKIAELEPLRTQSFQLNYTKAEEVAQGPDRPELGAAVGGGGTDGHPHPVAARQRDLRAAHQPAVRVGHPVQARGDHGADRQDRHPGAPGADRGPHRRGRRHLRPLAGRQARRHRPERHAAHRRHPRRRQLRRRSARRPARSPARSTSANSQLVNLPANVSSLGGASRRPPSRCRCSAPRPTAS